MTMLAQASASATRSTRATSARPSVAASSSLKVVVCFVFLLVATMFMVWFERKVIAGMQNRIGPNKAGPCGHPADAGRRHQARSSRRPSYPERADRVRVPAGAVPRLRAGVPRSSRVIPVGGDFTNGNDGVVTIFGHETLLQVADPPIGILFVLALSSIAVYGIMLAGWSSGSKYPLLGSVRASAQMVSYEAALGLSVATVLLVAGTLSTNGIVVGAGHACGTGTSSPPASCPSSCSSSPPRPS